MAKLNGNARHFHCPRRNVRPVQNVCGFRPLSGSRLSPHPFADFRKRRELNAFVKRGAAPVIGLNLAKQRKANRLAG